MVKTQSPQRGIQNPGPTMNSIRQSLETVRTMVNSVHRSHNGQQNLGRANVRGRFFAANVLLPRLEGHPVGCFAFGIHTYPDESAWKMSFVGITRRKKRGMRPPVAHGHPKALGRTHHHIRTPTTRRW